MKRKNIKLYIVCILLLGSFYACSAKRTSHNQNKDTHTNVENFANFYDRFLSDSLFQISRIKFPLPGINTEEMTLDDSVYYWKKEEWVLHEKTEIDTTVFNVRRTVTDTLAVEEIFLEDSGFLIRSEFRPIDGRWYLTYYVDSNL